MHSHLSTRAPKAQQGFTLVEALVSLALITIISLVVIGALAPWVGFKQSIDTERKLQDVKQGLLSYYDANAMTVEAQGSGRFGPFQRSALTPGQGCADQLSAFESLSSKFSESAQQVAKDGYVNPWCVLVSEPLSTLRDGVTLWYRNVAMVSTGRDGKLDTKTAMDSAGNLVTDGDDSGVVVSGYDVQAGKLNETLKRLERVSNMYETYFTTRFLANTDRDITRYYFSRTYDNTGAVPSTEGNWTPVASALASIGVASTDALTPWEQFNNIEVGNATEQINGVQVRSPATTGVGTLPYTALLRARLPAPAGQTAYATQVVVGNY